MTAIARTLRLLGVVAVAICSVGISAGSAATVPGDVVSAVHGRVVGWAKSGSDWFVVYLDRRGSGWCGMQGASWRIRTRRDDAFTGAYSR
jgi:hypothetical protein